MAQTFSINFVSSTINTQAKSGNPGYLDGLPLLIGNKNQANPAATNIFLDGFRLVGADRQGECISSAKTSLDQVHALQGDPVV